MSLQSDPGHAESRVLAEARRRAEHLGRPVLASWTRPTPLEDAIAFFGRASAAQHRLLWLRPSTGEAMVGIGAVQTLGGTGPERFTDLAAAWRELTAHAVVDDPTDRGPLLLGGFSFDPLREPSGLWAGFPPARMLLPERMLCVRDGRAWLTTNAVLPAGLATPPSSRRTEPAPALESLSPEAWQSLVASIALGIRQARLGVEKVVLARAVQVPTPQPLDVVGALRRLAAEYPGCTLFAVAHADACFLGATPERLISLHAGTATTMALAGSLARGATPDLDRALAARLLSDPKERAEHAVVVSALRAGLAEVCTRVVADAEPRVHKLPNLQHLLTPILATVADGRCVLDLVERLHPTPAVGGFPRQRALELIREHEGLDRGWYAGPIGWVDRAGDGEFVVGLRSALVRPEVATLFAGCGIVAESEPGAEYAESGWKLRPMLEALGLAG